LEEEKNADPSPETVKSHNPQLEDQRAQRKASVEPELKGRKDGRGEQRDILVSKKSRDRSGKESAALDLGKKGKKNKGGKSLPSFGGGLPEVA